MRATGKSMRAAKRLRRALTPPEAKLWQWLRGSPAGVRFRRQYPVGPFVADFYCPAAKLVIEVDGAIHDYCTERDEKRDDYLRRLGLNILRVSGAEVMTDAVAVADGIIALCKAGPSTTQLR